MIRAARAQQRDGKHTQHALTVAHVGVLVLAACGGDGHTTSDARPSCAATAEPHDEDGDGIFDSCDNCPSTPNPAQTDAGERELNASADGVGDACDPRPTVGGDTLREFHAFAHETDASAYTGSGFTISDDAAHASDGAMWTSARAQPGDGLYVLAQASSLALGAAGQLVIALDGDGIGNGVSCELSAGAITVREVGDASTSTVLATPIAADEPVTFLAARAIGPSPSGRVARIGCKVTRGTSTEHASLTLSHDLTTGLHAFAARDASAVLTSVSVYTSPSPKDP